MLAPIPIIEPATATVPPNEDAVGSEDENQQREEELLVNEFVINSEAIKRILDDPRYADKRVCLVSVAGAFRTGKSFILNFFLRYLRWRSQTAPSVDEMANDWLEMDPKLEGFSWRGGDDRDTNGILIWPEPFLLEDRNGEQVAVLLMDTQGIFDSVSTFKNCATVFALSTMVSSVQIFNINKTIQEDHLQHLQLFTEYARLALDEYNNSKPFQSLLFLVRDWSFPYDAEYGPIGGQRILDKRLEVTPRQHPELQQLRRHIRSSFDNIRCFLLPHPGLDVATNPHFRGELDKINPDFKAQLRSLVPHLFDPNNLVVKQIGGQPITCRELAVYINAYFEVFSKAELPEPKTILNATAEANHLAAVVSAKALYMREMEESCGGDSPFMSGAELRGEHARCRAEAMRTFQTAKKMGGPELAEQFAQKLEQDITEAFESFERVNNSKNLFKSMRTPAVLVASMIALYCCQEFFQLLGLDTIASIFSLFLTLIIVALGTWTYSRYSGQFRDAQVFIDERVQALWHNVLAPAFVNTAGGVALNMTTGGNFTLNSTTATVSAPSVGTRKEAKKIR
ncbi:hypothetical protein niasHT_007060 [Heterodera trifolii]|uniref:GB1/RHD3-type G domain-containing protein n=1 Tax=Heterodera trifolii TaxID=157864 RepID=A0ABD2LXE2_9BILA